LKLVDGVFAKSPEEQTSSGSRSRGLCGADPVGKTVVRRGRGVGAADGEAVAGGNSQPAREVREVLDRRTARLSRPIRTE